MNALVPHPEATRRYFSLEQANRTLPLVRMIVHDIVELYLLIRDRRERLADITRQVPQYTEAEEIYREEVEEMEASIYQDIEKLQSFVAELGQLGIKLKDPESGLVEYPALYDGREICLCWKAGEPEILNWHEAEDEFEELYSVDQLQSRSSTN